MMKSAMIGAVAGFLAFLAAWAGWGYVTGKFDSTIAPRGLAMKPPSAPLTLPVVPPALGASQSPRRSNDEGSPVAIGRLFERFEGTAGSTIPLPADPASAAVASSLPAQPAAAPTITRAVISTPLPPLAESIPLAVVPVSVVAPTVPFAVVNASNDSPLAVTPARTLEASVSAPLPSRSEADVARAQQAVAKFAAAQEALRNFRFQMPAMQAPATVDGSAARIATVSAPTAVDTPNDSVLATEVVSTPTRPLVLAPLALIPQDASMVVSTAVPPAAIRQRNVAPVIPASAPVPLVSFPGKSPGDAAGLTELDTLSRAAEAMKRLSKKLGSPRIR